jgi:hypothetical protein
MKNGLLQNYVRVHHGRVAGRGLRQSVRIQSLIHAKRHCIGVPHALSTRKRCRGVRNTGPQCGGAVRARVDRRDDQEKILTTWGTTRIE